MSTEVTTLETPSSAPPRPPDPSEAAGELQIIEPSRGWPRLDARELWRYRELLYFLVWRDIKIRYKQTALGAAWAVLQPLTTMVVFSLFFGRLAGLESRTGGIPYPIFVYAGLLPWTFVANTVSSCGNSILNEIHLITKVYFPRLVIPLSTAGAGLVDLGVAFVVLLGMMAWYGVGISAQLLVLPLLLLGLILAAAGVGLFFAALTVAYRDFRYVVPFAVQLWMFVTPVIYPPAIVPRELRWLLLANPVAGTIEGFRAAILGTPMPWLPVTVSLAIATSLFVGGVIYFRSVERRFADII